MKNALPRIIDFLLILVFTYAPLSKLTDLHAYFAALTEMPVIGQAPVFFGWALIIAELGTAGLLCFTGLRRWGLRAAALLLAAFTFFLVWMMLYLPALPCPCGGLLKGLGWKAHITLNSVLAAGAIYNLNLLRNNRGS